LSLATNARLCRQSRARRAVPPRPTRRT
jgi:hypothetical protein